MPKCDFENCDKEAIIEIDGKHYCSKHHIWCLVCGGKRHATHICSNEKCAIYICDECQHTCEVEK